MTQAPSTTKRYGFVIYRRWADLGVLSIFTFIGLAYFGIRALRIRNVFRFFYSGTKGCGPAWEDI